MILYSGVRIDVIPKPCRELELPPPPPSCETPTAAPSSWINRVGSILTVEEAADWVTHAVQLPEEVAHAFRSNSVSGYDFPELVEDNGASLCDDLGIKKLYRRQIVKVSGLC